MNRSLIVESLSTISLFKQLKESEYEIITNSSRLGKASKGEHIFNEGDDATEIYFLLSGIVKLGAYDDNVDKEIIKSIISSSTLFGEQCILGSTSHNSFAEVISKEQVKYVAIPKNIFKYLLQANFDFNLAFLESIGSRMRFNDHRIESLMLHDARFRIIEFIKDNAIRFGQKVGLETLIKHPLTQQDIANYTGTSRQTVTTVLNELKKANQIFLKRKSILVRDLESIS
jgi:CRP-like cAMP-binding protein